MKPAVFYRIASVLLLLFAALHTLGFRQVDPAWGADPVIGPMRAIHFDLMGSSRTYWDLFVGFGLLFSVFLGFTAVLAWQMGGLPDHTLTLLRGITWTLAVCLGAVTILCMRYAFIIPTAFSAAILVCFAAAAWLSAKPV